LDEMKPEKALKLKEDPTKGKETSFSIVLCNTS
jgi:hypothetical protein